MGHRNNNLFKFGLLFFVFLLLSFGFVVAPEIAPDENNPASCTSANPPAYCDLMNALNTGNKGTYFDYLYFSSIEAKDITDLVGDKGLTETGRNNLAEILKKTDLSNSDRTKILKGLIDANSGFKPGEGQTTSSSPANQVMSQFAGYEIDLGDLTSSKLKGDDAVKIQDGRLEISVNDRTDPMRIPLENLPDDLGKIEIEGNVVKNIDKSGKGILEISDGTYISKNDGKDLNSIEQKRWKLNEFKLANGEALKSSDTVTVGFKGEGVVRINGEGMVEATKSGNFGIKRDGKGTVGFSARSGVDQSSLKIELTDADTVTFKGSRQGLATLFDKNKENPVRMEFTGKDSEAPSVQFFGKGEVDPYKTESSGRELYLDSEYKGNSLETISVNGDISKVDGFKIDLPEGVNIEGEINTASQGLVTSAETPEGEKPTKSSVIWDGVTDANKMEISNGNINVGSRGPEVIQTPEGYISSGSQGEFSKFQKIDTEINGVKYSNVYAAVDTNGNVMRQPLVENGQVRTDANGNMLYSQNPRFFVSAGDGSTFYEYDSLTPNSFDGLNTELGAIRSDGTTYNANFGYGPTGCTGSGCYANDGYYCGGDTPCYGDGCVGGGLNLQPGEPIRNVGRIAWGGVRLAGRGVGLVGRGVGFVGRGAVRAVGFAGRGAFRAVGGVGRGLGFIFGRR